LALAGTKRMIDLRRGHGPNGGLPMKNNNAALKIAIVSPLFESVPPKLYGGTERVVSYLTEELVRQGHQVALYAAGDSLTQAELRATSPQGLRLDPDCHDALAHHMIMLDEVARSAPEFDVVHFHTDYLHFPLLRHLGRPALTTLHGRLDLPDLVPLYRHFDKLPLISISNSQRVPLPWANWLATVLHGVPEDLYALQLKPGSYLAFMGRMSPEKGPEHAIEIARRSGIPLRMAAKVDRDDRDYFEQHVRPLLDGPGVEFVGEISEAEKQEFLGGAVALLFPIVWPEPFGLAMIEAMACGTPVIAWRRGSVPEVVDEGITGYIADDVDQAVAAVAKCSSHDRQACRLGFEKRFTAARMARDYVAAYRRLMAQGNGSASGSP
jgi:glycosyltransferase involved in cell wall biosynthesis